MLRFFRTVRKNLIAQNRARNYLLYAMGEILLVVIGILIVLKDIKSDLEDNVANLEEGIELLHIGNIHCLEIISMYENKLPYNDSLRPYFDGFLFLWDPDFTYAGFDNLKSLGVNLISDKQLREDIITLIEVDIKILDESEVSRISQLMHTMILPMLRKYFHRRVYHLTTQDNFCRATMVI